MKQQMRIGIMLGSVYSLHVQQYLSGMIRKLRQYNAEVLIFTSFDANNQSDLHLEGEIMLFDMIHFDGLDGLLFVPETFSVDAFRERVTEIVQQRCRIPVVALGDSGGNYDTVKVNDTLSFAALTDHLIEVHQYRDIICMTGPKGNRTAEERKQGFLNSMKRHGLPAGEERILYGDYWRNTAKAYAEALVSHRAHCPEAVVCANDIMAITLCNTLIKQGWKIPGDLAIAGYDGTEYAFDNIPLITSFSRACEKTGEDSAELLMARIQQRSFRPAKAHTGQLQPGYTCGCNVDTSGAIMRRNEQRYNETLYINHYDDHGFAARIADADTLNALVHKIYIYGMIPYVQKYTLCIRENWRTRKERNSSWDNEIVYHMLEDGQHREFMAEEMLPPFLEQVPENHVYYFTPVHFQDHCFGYAIVQCLPGAVSFNSVYRRFSQEVNLSFEQLRLRERLRESTYHMYLSAIRDPLSGEVNHRGLLQYLEWILQHTDSDSEQILLAFVSVGSVDALSRQDAEAMLHDVCGTHLRFLKIRKDAYLIFGTVDRTETPDSFASRLKETAEVAERTNGGNFHGSLRCSVTHLDSGTQEDLKEILRQLWKGLEEQSRESENGNASRYSGKLKTIRESIYQNPGKEWSVESLAAQLYISHSHFHRLYKQMFRITFTRDLIHARIQYAKRLLTETDATLTVIAEQCGYHNLSHFMRQFHAETSMTPSQYRKQ